MNYLKHLAVGALLLGVLFAFSGCLKDDCMREITYIKYTPVYAAIADIQAITVEASRELEQPGKIYFYNDYIFINEVYKGIHIIDNTEPSAPSNLGFIKILGNRDMAIMGDYLYADNGSDLVTLDISDPLNAQLIDRQVGAFPPTYETEQGWFVYYDEEVVTEVVECNSSGWGGGFVFSENLAMNDAASTPLAAGSTTNSGIGGSMARFTIASGHLYAVDQSSMNVFDITSNPAAPNELNEVEIGWGIETIFPYQDKLFIGSESGMFIFDNSNPTAPVLLSAFEHARACDPVFVKDNYAYVTLRSGTACEGFTNQLDLVDITNLTNPVLEKTFPMNNPHGLSIRNNDLYICEGEYGIKTFDIETPKTLDQRQRTHLQDLHAFDVIAIPNTNLLLVIGNDGLYQYDAKDISNLRLVSKIEVG